MSEKGFEAQVVDEIASAAAARGYRTSSEPIFEGEVIPDLVVDTRDGSRLAVEVKTGPGALDFTSVSQAASVIAGDASNRVVILTTQDVSESTARYARDVGVNIVLWRGPLDPKLAALSFTDVLIGTDTASPGTLAIAPLDKGTTLEVRALGPIEVAMGSHPVDIGGVKARVLIARLLMDRGHAVSIEHLIDALWGDHDGVGAETALRSTISRLRKRLRDAGVSTDVILVRAPGYVLDVPAEATDIFQFEQLVTEGRRQLAGHRPSESARLLREAQDLWRGPAYSGVRDEPFARTEVRRLDELLLLAIETRIDALLTIGRHDAVVAELETLTSANPMREHLWSQRMLALYRAGEQAQALRVFHDLRSILVDRLGVEPGHEVTSMERAILIRDPVLDLAQPPEADAAADTSAPNLDNARTWRSFKGVEGEFSDSKKKYRGWLPFGNRTSQRTETGMSASGRDSEYPEQERAYRVVWSGEVGVDCSAQGDWWYGTRDA